MKFRLALFVTLALALLVPFARHASAQTTIACEQVYSVTAGDWLSNIADKFYGDVSAYNAIFRATNLKAQTDASFAALASPDAVEVGQKLCIPSKADAEQLLSAPAAFTPPATAPETTTPAATSAPVSATDATATPVPFIVTDTSGLRPEDVTFNAYGLGEVVGRIVPALAYDNSEPPGPVGAPAHVAFSLEGEDRLWVIPSAAYQQQWDAAGNNSVAAAVTRLRLLLRDKPETQNPPLPFLPAMPATNDLAARIRYLDFNGGSGIAYIGRWAQDPSPVLASQTYYSFLGLTNDGKYIVSFRYPVHTSALPDAVDELTPEHFAEIETDPRAYLQQTTEILNQLGNSAFGPDLSRLDALVFSISVPSVGAVLPPPADGNLATPAAPADNASGGDKARLLATDWKWVETTSPTGTLTVDDPDKYILRFNNANGFGITADCNFGAGNYTVSGDVLTIIDLQATEAFCGANSLDTLFTVRLLQAATYSFEGNNLLIELKDGAGSMKFSK